MLQLYVKGDVTWVNKHPKQFLGVFVVDPNVDCQQKSAESKLLQLKMVLKVESQSTVTSL